MVILATVLACRPAPEPDPTPLREVELANGLRITVLRHPHPPEQVTLELLVAAGSRHDLVPGTAHFVEHLAFRGAQSWLEAWGGPLGPDQNAHTSPDATWFHVTGSTLEPSWLEVVPDLLRQRADGVAFDPVSIEAERDVLRAELEPRALDPGARAMLAALPRIGPDELATFHATWYRPDRAELIAVGDLDPDATLVALAGAFASWAASGDAPRPPPAPPRHRGVRAAGGSEEIVSVEVPVAHLDRPSAELVAAVAANRLAGVARATLDGDRIAIDAGSLRRPGAPSLPERVLEALAPATGPDAAEADRARDVVRLGWIDRPFALEPASSITWREALHEARARGRPLPTAPHEAADALLGAVRSLSAEDVADAWGSAWRWEALALDIVGSAHEETLEVAFRTEHARPDAPPSPALPEAHAELDVLLVEPGVAVWRLPGGGEVLYRQLDVPVAVVGVDGVVGRALPEELAPAIARFPSPNRVVIAGPLPVAEAADAVSRGLPTTSSTGTALVADARAPRHVGGGLVEASWSRPLARPDDLEALPVLVETLEIEIADRLRDRPERHCDLTVARAHTTVTLRAWCGSTEGERVLGAVRQAVSAIVGGTARRVPRRFVPADPRDPDPTRWVEALVERGQAWPSLVEAWRAPRRPAPDAAELGRLARDYLR